MKKGIFVFLLIILGIIISASSSTEKSTLSDLSVEASEQGSILHFCDSEPCIGYQFKRLWASTLMDRTEVTDYVPFPLGSNINFTLPLCLVDTYETDSDDDVGWRCDYALEYVNGLPWMRFTLRLLNDESDRASIKATALVLDLNEFELVDYYQFQAFDDESLISHNLYVPFDGFTVTEVNTYDTATDDDFYYYVGLGPYPELPVYVNVFNGNSNSYISGGVYVLRPAGNNTLICRGDVYIENKEFSWISNQEYVTPDSCAKPPFNLDQEEVVVGSITSYYAEDMDFEVETSVLGTSITSQFWLAEGYGDKGNNDSRAWLELTLFGYTE